MQILDCDNDLEYIVNSGRMNQVASKNYEKYSVRRDELKGISERIESNIYETVKRCVAMVTSEIRKLNSRQLLAQKGKNKLNKLKNQRGQALYIGEIRLLLKKYLKLVEEMEECMC